MKTALEDEAHFFQVKDKRKIFHPPQNPLNHVTKGTKLYQSPNLLVTKPSKVYKVSELVPPTFFLGIEESPTNFFNAPKTYQSYLAAKYNIIPSKYLPRPQVKYPQKVELKDWSVENNFQYKTVTESTLDADWKIHWIEKR